MLYAALVMSVVAWLVPQREIDWQPTVFWALAYSAILATALALELMAVCIEKLTRQYRQPKHVSSSCLRRTLSGGCSVKIRGPLKVAALC